MIYVKVYKPNFVTSIQQGDRYVNLKSSKSCGHDNLSANFLKQIKVSLSLPICHLINRSISNGKMPEELKIAKVVPIFEAGTVNCFKFAAKITHTQKKKPFFTLINCILLNIHL